MYGEFADKLNIGGAAPLYNPCGDAPDIMHEISRLNSGLDKMNSQAIADELIILYCHCL